MKMWRRLKNFMRDYYTEQLSDNDARRLLNNDYMSGCDYFLTIDLQHVVVTGKDKVSGDEFEFELTPEETQIRDDIVDITDVERKPLSNIPLYICVGIIGLLFAVAVIFSLGVMMS